MNNPIHKCCSNCHYYLDEQCSFKGRTEVNMLWSNKRVDPKGHGFVCGSHNDSSVEGVEG